MKNRLITIILVLLSTSIWGNCHIFSNSPEPSLKTDDALIKLLRNTSSCPQDVFALRDLLKNTGYQLQTTLVANRGFHNKSAESFSLFEIVIGNSLATGDFFFGHFTSLNKDGYLIADQNPAKNALMIEAIAWDNSKKLFNFYELRGDGREGQWYYRGDSADILTDNKFLHRQPDSKHPIFGSHLRCSACHTAGGPIMKELDLPNNDWWQTKRPLNFANRLPDKALKEIFTTLVDAKVLAKSVQSGVNKLYQQNLPTTRSLQETLRPLFCPMEINLQSDNYPNDSNQREISIPLEFFLDAHLLPSHSSIIIARNDYAAALSKISSHFPETNLPDADHAWLTPVKGIADEIAITQLIKQKIIDEKFMFDVLAIDMTNPVFSKKRCQLLQYLPHSSSNWREIFINNLNHSNNETAQQLAHHMQNKKFTAEFYKKSAALFLGQCQAMLTDQHNVEKLVMLLFQRRNEVRTAEISANKLGQILEPGFKIIFPETKKLTAMNLRLNTHCEIKRESLKN